MPREGKAKRSGRRTAREGPAVRRGHEEEEDNSSVNSESTVTTINSDGEEEECSELEQFETKIKQAIEYAQEKSHNTRLKGLLELRRLLQSRAPVDGELSNLHATLSDVAERSIKRGTSASERVAGARLAAVLMLVAINLNEDIVEQVYSVLQPTLLVVCQDPTVSAVVREEACRSVAVLAFFGATEYTQLQESINTLHGVFSKALPKGNGELPNLQSSALLMHSAALQGFHLLLTLANPSDLITRTPTLLGELLSVLETRELEMRTEVGTGVALVYELARTSKHFRWRREPEMLDILNELATDSHKHRGKSERKQQRAIFRAVVTSVEDEHYTPEQVTLACKRGVKDVLEINSWNMKYRYDCVCRALENGVSTHLLYNHALRDRFELPELEILDETESREQRSSRRREQGLVHKMRDQIRNKNRDNRAMASNYED